MSKCPLCAGIVEVLPCKSVKARFWYWKKQKSFDSVRGLLVISERKAFLQPRFCLNCCKVFWQNKSAGVLVVQCSGWYAILKGKDKVEGCMMQEVDFTRP